MLQISLLRKDRDLGEGEIEELMRDRAQVEGTLFTVIINIHLKLCMNGLFELHLYN